MRLEQLGKKRRELDRIDRGILKLLAKRAAVIVEIGRIKHRFGIPVLQRARIDKRMSLVKGIASELGISAGLAAGIFRLIIAESMRIEKGTG
jgi:chorismate mutase / prephenate dehydrogenase